MLVAIVGGSGAGKTWLADRLETALGPRCGRVSLDDFYRDLSHLPPARRARVNFDHPRAIDWVLFRQVLEAIRRGRPVRLPRYDFVRHVRAGYRKAGRPPAVLLVDGLWLLRSPAVRRVFALRLFVDAPVALRKERRLERDRLERGRSGASIRRQFREHVQPMHARFVEPQRTRADRILGPKIHPSQIAVLARILTGFAR